MERLVAERVLVSCMLVLSIVWGIACYFAYRTGFHVGRAATIRDIARRAKERHQHEKEG